MNLKDGDFIVTAYAESCAGPGWANTPVWIIVQDKEGKLRKECLQPDEQNETMRTLYYISEEAHCAMRRAVEKINAERK